MCVNAVTKCRFVDILGCIAMLGCVRRVWYDEGVGRVCGNRRVDRVWVCCVVLPSCS